jgi:HD-GYP domain-containing protein (c-di-GMP phosphodiesterase class II)
MTIAEARTELLRVSGTQLDPSLVGLIVKLIDNGTLVASPVHADEDHHHGASDLLQAI